MARGGSLDPAGIERLKQRAGGHVRVTTSEGDGRPALRPPFEPGAAGDLMAASGAPARDKARQFLREYSSVFGIADVDAELQLGRDQTDEIGARHVTFFQTYRGVPSSPDCCALTSEPAAS
jgi:hypothetical protein